MRVKQQIIFTLAGVPPTHDIELSVLAEKINQLQAFLHSSIDANSGEVTFSVVKLSHSSPVAIVCQPIGEGDQPALALARVHKYMELATTHAADLPDTVLKTISKLVKTNTKIDHARLQIIGTRPNNQSVERAYDLDAHFHAKLSEVQHNFRHEIRQISSVCGKLEQINIHTNPNTFKLYTELPIAPTVTCECPPELIKIAQSSLTENPPNK